MNRYELEVYTPQGVKMRVILADVVEVKGSMLVFYNEMTNSKEDYELVAAFPVTMTAIIQIEQISEDELATKDSSHFNVADALRNPPFPAAPSPVFDNAFDDLDDHHKKFGYPGDLNRFGRRDSGGW